MKVLIISEPTSTFDTAQEILTRLVRAVLPLGDITVLVAGATLPDNVEKMAALAGVSRLILVEHPALAGLPAENLAALVTELAPDFTHIVAAASTFGASVLPRIAALLDVAAVTGVSAIVDASTFIRPVQAGNFLATIQVIGQPVCLTLRTAKFEPVAILAEPTAKIDYLKPSIAIDLGLSRLLEVLPMEQKGRPHLASARIVVAGGGGMEKAGDFSLIETLADALGAAVGATRAAVDAELAPAAWQIGQTGQIIAPELYVGVGISGAIQHLAGIKEAKIIVAINNDPSAAFLAIADFGLQADLYQVVPELVRNLQTYMNPRK